MKRTHELIVLGIKVSNFALEVFDQFQRGKLHQEMLDSPFAVELTHLILLIGDLSIDVASQLKQELHQIHEFIFVLQELVETLFLSILLII